MCNLTENRIIKFIRNNGGYFGIIGAISMALSALISFFLNSSVNPSFNIVSYAVSDLISGTAISRIIFSVGLIIASFCQIPLYTSLINYITNKESYVFLSKITALTSFLSIISHNILSLVPSERNILPLFLTHGIAAGIHYITGTISLILIGRIEFLNIKVSKVLAIISYITGALYGIVWIRYLLSLIVGIEELFMYYLFQWFALAGVILWSLFHGIFLIKAKKRALDNRK